MSKYKFDVSLVISGLSEGVFELRPSDYLYCEDEDELFDEVNDTLRGTLRKHIKFSRVYTCESDWRYPKGFLEEWRRLKNER